MLTTLTVILVIVAVAILGLIAYAATRPDTFEMTRSMNINSRPEEIFPLIANLRVMDKWNPFVKADPAIKLTYSGPESGVGATNVFEGNNKVGSGSIAITEAAAPSKIVMQLDMIKPMRAHNRVDFTLVPRGDTTNVTWTMSGRQPLIAKVMTIFIDCDKMVGGQFEKGLADLKAIAESKASLNLLATG